jgi:predicted nucleic acid-binding Zn ribbon protein
MDDLRVKEDGENKRLKVWELIIFLILVLFVMVGMLFLI